MNDNMKIDIASERNSSFELLRLLLMFMILVHHSIIFGLSLESLSSNDAEMIIRPEHMWLFSLVNCMCIPAVNIFVLISGYFGLRPTVRKIVKLMVTMSLYTLVFYTLYSACIGNFADVRRSIWLFSDNRYWFISYYMFLMCFAPPLNAMFEQMDRGRIRIFVLSLVLLSCYFGFFRGMSINYSGYSLFQFIMMYCIGRYIRVFDISVKTSRALLTYILCSVVCGTLMYLFYRTGSTGRAWRLTAYNDPVIVASAIALFLAFKNLRFSSRIINKFALSALAVYLVQSSKMAGDFYYQIVSGWYCSNGFPGTGGGILLMIAICAIAFIVFSISFDQIQIRLNKPISDWLTPRLEHFVDQYLK